MTPPNVHNCSCYKQPPKIGSGDIGISSILSTHNVHCATALVLCTKNIIVNLSIRSIFNLEPQFQKTACSLFVSIIGFQEAGKHPLLNKYIINLLSLILNQSYICLFHLTQQQFQDFSSYFASAFYLSISKLSRETVHKVPCHFQFLLLFISSKLF